MRIAIFYFFYMGTNGIITPFLPPYFRSLGFSGTETSVLMSLVPALMIFVPPLWGLAADRTKRPAMLLKVACAGAALSFAFLLTAKSFAAVALVLACYGIFVTTISSLADTIAVSEAKRIGTDYSRLRIWGSIGFIVGTYSFAQHLSSKGAGSDVVIASVLFAFAYAIAALFVRPVQGASTAVPSFSDAARLLSTPAFFAFLIAAMLHWASQATYYLFFALRIEELKLDPWFVGAGISLGVLAEVAMMWFFRPIIGRVPLFTLLGATFVITAARWLMISRTTDAPALAAIQVLHGFSFGAFFVGSIAHLERAVPEHLRATGRALYTSVVFGIGGIAGNALGGVMYDTATGADRTARPFLAAALLELLAPVALLVCARLYQKQVAAAPVVAEAA